MTATIIPFPAAGPARHPTVGAPAAAITTQAPPRADAGPSSSAPPASTDPAAKSGTPLTRIAIAARPGVAAIPYAGPCRRARSARSLPVTVPGRPASAQVPHASLLTPPSPPDRLARALDSLRAAFVQQNAVLAAWRASLADLLGASASLHTGLAQHDAAMRDLDVRLSRLQDTPQPAPRALTR